MASFPDLKDELVEKIYVGVAGRFKIFPGDDLASSFVKNTICHLLATLYDVGPMHEEKHATVSKEMLQISRKVQTSFRPLNQLNAVLVHQKKVSEELSIYEKVHEKTKERFGIDHPATLMTGNDIGILLSYQGKYDEALVILKDSFDKSKKQLGPKHRTTVDLQNNLAYVLDKKGQYDEALCNYSEVFELLKDHMDKNDRIIIRQHIASLLGKKGKYEQSMSIYRDIETQYEKCRDELVNKNKKCIAGILSQQGKYDETLKILNEILEYEESAFGPEHLFTLTTESNRSLVYMKQGRYREALKTYLKVWRVLNSKMSQENPVILSIENNMAVAYFCLGEFKEAKAFFEFTYEKVIRVLGPNHTLTLMCKRNALFADAQYVKYHSLNMLREVYEEIYDLGSRCPGASVMAQKMQSLSLELKQLSIDLI